MKIFAAVVAGTGLFAGVASGISGLEFDDFEGGVTEGWSHGAPSPVPPFVVTESSNTFLRVLSTGTGGPGSRMAVFNRAQWTGDYLTAGVSAVSFDVRNSGETDLSVRIGLVNFQGLRAVTNEVITLGAGSGWVSASLSLTDLELGVIGSLEDALSGVIELRFVSAENPAFEGDFINGSMDLDNIRAVVPAPGGAALLGVAGLAGLRRRR